MSHYKEIMEQYELPVILISRFILSMWNGSSTDWETNF